MAESQLLQASNISKSYVGVHALKSASFELRAGEVHALIGENGAGKSTLIKVITGAVEPDGGAIELDGQTITHNSPRVAKQLGIAAIYQQPALFPELTVAENIALGQEQAAMLGRVDWQARRRRAAELLTHVGATIDVDTQNLFRVIRQLRASGVGIVYISHRLEELPVIADRVTVLRDGCTIDTRLMSEVNRQQLIQLMVGRELSAVFPKKEVALGDVALELRQFGCGEAGIKNINLA